MIPVIDETHDPKRRSWLASANGHAAFPIQNLPLGVFSTQDGGPRGGVAIGDSIVDLAVMADTGLLGGTARDAARAASGPALNPLLAMGTEPRRALRRRLFALLSEEGGDRRVPLCDAEQCTLHLPAAIGDYTDFYAGIHHATNVGRQFRPDEPLLPNYKYVPIGYHGRASSIQISGAAVRRPSGQRRPPGAEEPLFGPTRRLDYELELGIWIGNGNALGDAIPIAEAGAHLAGLCLLNDWSARDLQAWEYQPLGPFLAKNFATTISPWIVTAEALAPFRVAQAERPQGDPRPLPYLWDADDQAYGAFAIDLEVRLSTAAMRAQDLPPHRLSRGSAASLYWTAAQLVAHHSSNGCNLRPGDVLGTGTISGPDRDSYGSLLEISAGGKEPVSLASGETRTFLEDGDEVAFTATARRDGYVPIGFGACGGEIMAAGAR